MRRFVVLMIGVLLATPAPAASWRWLADFTDPSSKEYALLLEELNTAGLISEIGVPVSDVHWQEDGIDAQRD